MDVRKLPPLLKDVMVVDHLVPLKTIAHEAAVQAKCHIVYREKKRQLEIANNPDCCAARTVTLQSIMAIVESK